MHEIRVISVSREEASYGVAEFWAGGELIAYTHYGDSDLMLRIDPRRDGAPVVVGAHSLAIALAEPKGSSPTTEGMKNEDSDTRERSSRARCRPADPEGRRRRDVPRPRTRQAHRPGGVAKSPKPRRSPPPVNPSHCSPQSAAFAQKRHSPGAPLSLRADSAHLRKRRGGGHEGAAELHPPRVGIGGVELALGGKCSIRVYGHWCVDRDQTRLRPLQIR